MLNWAGERTFVHLNSAPRDPLISFTSISWRKNLDFCTNGNVCKEVVLARSPSHRRMTGNSAKRAPDELLENLCADHAAGRNRLRATILRGSTAIA
jgi:hypothetical protein